MGEELKHSGWTLTSLRCNRESVKALTALYILCCTLTAAYAQDAIAPPHAQFGPGHNEFEMLGGPIFSLDSGPNKPAINFAIVSLRYGIMLTTPREGGWFAGNTEFLFEGYGGAIFTGPGNGVGALNLILRRNFLYSGATVVPYAQLGGGGVYTDVSRNKSEALLGSELNFSAEGALGLRFLLNARFSFLVEHNFVHYSNAGTTSRNHGVNSIGGQAGFALSY